jgi:hypothetical protein
VAGLAHLAVAADLGYLAFAALADLAAGLAPNNVKRTKFFIYTSHVAFLQFFLHIKRRLYKNSYIKC